MTKDLRNSVMHTCLSYARIPGMSPGGIGRYKTLAHLLDNGDEASLQAAYNLALEYRRRITTQTDGRYKDLVQLIEPLVKKIECRICERCHCLCECNR